VENPAVTSRDQTGAAGRSGISVPGAGYRRIDKPGGRRFHPADRTNWDAAVSGRGCSMATAILPGRGFGGDWLPAVPLFSLRARQRSAADQGCAVCPGRPHHASHRDRKVLLHIGNARQRNSAWARRAFRSSRCGHCFSPRAAFGVARRKSKGASAGRCGSSNCGCV
jgi:hypothetical protein